MAIKKVTWHVRSIGGVDKLNCLKFGLIPGFTRHPIKRFKKRETKIMREQLDKASSRQTF